MIKVLTIRELTTSLVLNNLAQNVINTDFVINNGGKYTVHPVLRNCAKIIDSTVLKLCMKRNVVYNTTYNTDFMDVLFLNYSVRPL